jgi:hypothetical protein
MASARSARSFAIISMDLTIREATADDAPAAWEIGNTVLRHACKGFYSDEVLALWTDGDMRQQFCGRTVRDPDGVMLKHNLLG